MKNKICFKTLYFTKIIAVLLIFVAAAVLFGSLFTHIYKPYIKSLAIGKCNYLIQKLFNDTVLRVLKSEDDFKFVNIVKNSQENISGIETNTVNINKFKSRLTVEITKGLRELQNEKIAVPILAFLNNPFLYEKGPSIYIKVRPTGILNTDVKSTFESVGVNQTKHQLDIECDCKIIIIMPAVKIEHTLATTVPVAQTVIVGDVPQTYTNVVTSQEKLDDTVLQLAVN